MGRAGVHRDVTYLIQNHPVITDLYSQHRGSIDFAGVILYDRGDEARRKERNAYYAAKLASLLEADGAILTYLGSGHSIVDVMMVCELLERSGITTVLLLPEMAADPQESGLADFVPEAKAIVSTGNYSSRSSFRQWRRFWAATRCSKPARTRAVDSRSPFARSLPRPIRSDSSLSGLRSGDLT